VLVTGTGTEVGTTWTAAAIARALLEHRCRVAARKPAQSFAPGDTTDADLLATATGDDVDAVCPRHRWYEVPMAPPMAADALGRPPFTIADLVGELAWPNRIDVGLIEGVGGPRSPLAHDGDTVDLATAVSPDLVVLVADAGLGAINAVHLATAPFATIAPVCVFLNRYDDTDELHHGNREWFAAQPSLDVVIDVRALTARVAADA
jgi:dethiobiotin synthetase